ncbi:DUF1499 domain-containing protein [Sphaerotilus sp.]|uniref:DUF1499 domain-containing protein n=1 Tax=Sphaerotilus sp. TaxID=2093942 RepID=UPI002ACDDB5A|nr:DUF1499 domain-containing protein [Sphaerotilus sp.]MDZ7858627.1 DUF1499 domain-containing protein [Sphaerotilus sp.]
MKKLLLVLIGVVVAVLTGARLGLLNGQRPGDLGVTNGRLKPPSLTRNSVSSQARLYPDHPQRAYAAVEPLPLHDRNAEAALQTLAAVLRDMPGVTLVEQRPDYLYAQAQTRWLRFVDDVEFWVDPAAGVVEVRSASRLGREDFGVNRARIEAVRAAYLAAPSRLPR